MCIVSIIYTFAKRYTRNKKDRKEADIHKRNKTNKR